MPIYAGDQSADLAAIDISSAATVITATSGKTVRLVAVEFSVSAASAVVFQTATLNTVFYRTPSLAANTPYTMILGNGHGKLAPAADDIEALSSAAASITGTLWYTEQ